MSMSMVTIIPELLLCMVDKNSILTLLTELLCQQNQYVNSDKFDARASIRRLTTVTPPLHAIMISRVATGTDYEPFFLIFTIIGEVDFTHKVKFKKLSPETSDSDFEEKLCKYIISECPDVGNATAGTDGDANKVVQYLRRFPDETNRVVDCAYKYIHDKSTTHYISAICLGEEDKIIEYEAEPVQNLFPDKKIKEILNTAINFYLRKLC